MKIFNISISSHLATLCMSCLFVLVALSMPMTVVAKELGEIDKYRGINMYFHAEPVEDDYKLLKTWGVGVIRLFIHASKDRKDYDGIYDEGGDAFDEAALERIDRAVVMAAKYNIKVILATATFPGYNSEIWSDYAYWERLIKLWSGIASRYKSNDTVIGYHPIDEAHLVKLHGSMADYALMRSGKWRFPDAWRGTPKDYFRLIKKLGVVFGNIDPAKFIVVSGVGIWGFADNYSWMEPITGINAVYSFNPYIPADFANSGKKDKKNSKVRKLASYSSVRDKERLYSVMQPVVDFARDNKAKIFVSGFGIPYTTEGMGAKEWMSDMLEFFNKNKWGWAYFSYGIPFRSPEVVGPGVKKGEWIKSEHTERLMLLKEYWQASP